MNGRNKRWLEQRWDAKQPARLAHIKEKRLKNTAKPARDAAPPTKKEE